MKSVLTILFVVLLASGSQARQIPADSLFGYYEQARVELNAHIANFNQICKGLLDKRNSDYYDAERI